MDKRSMARLTLSAEHLLAAYRQLIRAVPVDAKRLDESKLTLRREDNTYYGMSAAASIQQLPRHLERSAMHVLRQLAYSLPQLPLVKGQHIRTVVELWTALVTRPTADTLGGIKAGVPFESVAVAKRHYEALTLLKDVLDMLSRVDLDRLLDVSLGDAITAALGVLQGESVAALMRDISASQKEPTDARYKAIKAELLDFFLLNWGESGAWEIQPMSEGTTAKSAHTLYALLQKSTILKLSAAREQVARKLLEVFPQCAAVSSAEGSPSRARSEASEQSRASATQHHPIMSDAERAAFLKGRGVSKWAPESHRIRFSRGVFLEPEGAIAGWEFPCLYPVCDTLDVILDVVQAIRFRDRLPTCIRGHLLMLVESDDVQCSIHPEQGAVWTCPTCQCNYGSCCRSHPPSDFDGSAYERTVLKDSRTCDRCDLALLMPHRVAFTNKMTKDVVCRYCAAEPYPRLSTRWLAAYKTWVHVSLAVLVFWFFMIIIEA